MAAYGSSNRMNASNPGLSGIPTHSGTDGIVYEKSCGAVIWKPVPASPGAAPEGPAHLFLLVQHRARHWSFPKGHVEGGETEVETAAREIMEETGCEVEIDTAFREVVTYSPQPGHVKDVVFFLATPTGGEEHYQVEELVGMGWYTFEEAEPLVTFASDVEVLRAAERYILAME